MDAILFWFAISMAVISLSVLAAIRVVDFIKWLYEVYGT